METAIKTFKHSGDLGDIIYSLPTIKALGGGILYLDPNGGKGTGDVNLGYKDHTNLNKVSIDFLTPLLCQLPYIEAVMYWNNEKVDYNLDLFRKHLKFNNLCYSHLEAFNLPHKNADFKWLLADGENDKAKNRIVISRTPKVQGNHIFWEFQIRPKADQCLFVGLPKEHEIFEYALGYKVEYLPVSNALELAVHINNCAMFIGNQSLPHAIAEGLKKPIIIEVGNYPAAVFKREGAVYI